MRELIHRTSWNPLYRNNDPEELYGLWLYVKDEYESVKGNFESKRKQRTISLRAAKGHLIMARGATNIFKNIKRSEWRKSEEYRLIGPQVFYNLKEASHHLRIAKTDIGSKKS